MPSWMDTVQSMGLDASRGAPRMPCLRVANSPEIRLVAAVLEEALRCIERHRRSRAAPRREFHEAHAWFFDAEQDGPFAFEMVTTVLGLDPDAVRDHVRQRLAQRTEHVPQPFSVAEDAA